MEVTICGIFSRSLLPEYKKRIVVISKSSYRKVRATTRVILSQIICCFITANWRRWISLFTLAKIIVAFFLYQCGFTIQRLFRSSLSIEYTTPWPIWEQSCRRVSHDQCRSYSPIILMWRLELTPCFMILKATVWFFSFFLVWLTVVGSVRDRSTISQSYFSLSIAYIRLAHWGQFSKP